MKKDRSELTELERENQRLREALATLDEIPGKSKVEAASDLKGVSDMDTSVSKGLHSMPGQEDRYYLDLYLLQKERERLVKETAWIKKRRLRVGRKIAEVDKTRAQKEELALANMTILSGEPTTGQASPPAPAGSANTPDKKPGWNQLTIEY